jgi:hypothetical protein
MPFVDAKEQLILNHLFRNTSLALPATNWFLGLSTTTPTDAGGNFTEPSTGAYARIAVVRTGAGFSAASGTAPAAISNSGVVTFPTATASWGTLTHWGVFELVSGANLWLWEPLTTPRLVSSGDTPSYAAGALIVKAGKPTDTF